MAQAIEILISYGHSSEDVFNYTPKRIDAFLHFAMTRRKREFAELLNVFAMASRGEPKDVKKMHQELMKE